MVREQRGQREARRNEGRRGAALGQVEDDKLADTAVRSVVQPRATDADAIASKSAGADLRAEFLEEKEAVQSIETVDIREKRLDALDSHWMDRLEVAAVLEDVLLRHPDVENIIARCLLKLARAKEDERAYLYAGDAPLPGSRTGKPTLVVQLTADTLLARERLEPLVMTTLAKARRPS